MAKTNPKETRQPPLGATVVPIRPKVKIPEANGENDSLAISIARMADSMADKAYQLAQTQPNSKEHLHAIHMSGIDCKLPRNNLRLIVRPEGDPKQQFFTVYRRAKLAVAKAEMIEAQISLEAHEAEVKDGLEGHGAIYDAWSERRTAAWADRDHALEDLAAFPADREWFHGLKRSLLGSRQWLASARPKIAATLDAEEQRLNAEKAERKAARAAKKGGL